MRDHVYPCRFIDILPNGFVLLELDLGFGLRNTRPFRLHLDGVLLYDSAWDAIPSWLSQADAIMVKSISPSPGQFYADISFKAEDRWYNLLRLLAEEGYTWKGQADAS